ncbi:16S rRNA (cytidine(1402)-2'-O)-methyltransferase [bacterium]|nr:16S rRNA (cytidine(1402)-2'-O)-methyltransferase [bacterium]
MREFDLYIVPTPIGNLGDITQRALEILSSVDVIACEDIRVTQKLLNQFNIGTKCVSYHKFNEKERLSMFVNLLEEGKKIALVSDAGTPLFCDPGAVLVKELREKGFKITALAGANAVATFLSQVAREGEDFFFAGFLPRIKGQIEALLERYKNTDIVFYESPNRIMNTLNLIKEFNPSCRVAVGRELTKVFEEVVEGSAAEVIEYFQNNVLKGEIVGIVFRTPDIAENIDIESKIQILKKKNFSSKDISVILSSLYNISKNDVYKKSSCD